MGETEFAIRRPSGNHRCIASPIMRPKAAPILNTGIKLPDGTGNVEANTVKKNYQTNWIMNYITNKKKWLLTVTTTKIPRFTKMLT